MAVEYRDDTPFVGDNHTPTELANAIRTKKNAKDVREPIAQAVEKLSNAVLGKNIGNVVATPTKVFDNLSKLQEAYPAGADGVMVTVDTGHKYFWQNNAWVDGGVYQSVGISNDLQQIVDHGYKSNMVTINAKNYMTALPDLNDAEINSVYRLDFDAGVTELPAHVPVKQWPDYFNNAILIVTEQPHAQIMYIANDVFVRYVGRDYAWTDWYSVSGFNTGNITINSTDVLADLNNLAVGKMVSVSTAAAKTVANTPTDEEFNVITLNSRIFDENGRSQLAYDRYNNWYVRSKDIANNWSNWTKLSSELAIDAVREEYFSKYENQNVIWQRKNNKNVVMDKWIDDKDKVQDYNGWCYTNYFIPVRPNHDYSFVAKDSLAIDYNVVGVDSVYINLYDDKLKYINQIYTKDGGVFNTQNAYYIKVSMSYRTYIDRQYLSLILGKNKPTQLDAIENANYSDSALYANGSASYDLVPSTDVYKLDSLPLRLYTDSMTRWSIGKPEIYLYDNRKNEVTYDSVTQSYLLPAKPRTALSVFGNTFHAIKGRATNSYWKFDAKTLDKYTIITQRDIPSSFGDGQNLNVMFIGDSLTNAGVYVNRVGELASADGHTTINLLGTRGETYKHEGRGGWSAGYYCTKTNFNTYDNPFLNLNGKFDFSYYAAKNNITKLDIVFLNLGTNDVTYNDIEKDPNFDEDLKYYKEILSSIKSTFPNVKIVLGSTITPARYKGANLYVKTRRQEWNDKILSLCLSEGYTYAPYSLIIDPVNDFKYKEEALDDYNATTVKRVDDNTHPADSGYKKMGDLSYSIIKKLAEDIKTGN